MQFISILIHNLNFHVLKFSSLLISDIEEMDDATLSANAPSGDVSANGDNDPEADRVISLPAHEYTDLVARLSSAEQRAQQAADALQNALADVEKMR